LDEKKVGIMSSQNSSDRQYYLITNVHSTTTSSNDREIDLHAQSWQLPYEVDDKDLMFDGKPLNMLYEENRYMAEHHVSQTREHVSAFFPLIYFIEGLTRIAEREKSQQEVSWEDDRVKELGFGFVDSRAVVLSADGVCHMHSASASRPNLEPTHSNNATA
jgi:hypothetical protein